MSGKKECSGRQNNQKMKPFLVYDYLMRESDNEHFLTTDDIKDYLFDDFGIVSERRSIYNDIHEINKVLLALQKCISIEEAEALIEENDEYKIIRHHKRKGFYVSKRTHTVEDIRLLAECVYSAKFVDEERAEKLADIVLQLVSTQQAETINHHAIVKNRVKTANTAVFDIVRIIHNAIGKGGDFTRKIKFQYLKHTLQNVKNLTERKRGANYIVTPYSLIIDNGNYYLLGYDENKQELRTYRVDRMANVKITQEYNLDGDKFKNIDIDNYTQEHFGMFGGNLERITLNCSVRLLDAIIDRFGTDNITYIPVGKSHFNIRISVYISEQFFGWLSGFGKQIQILSPLSVREEYAEYLKAITEWHSRSVDKKQQ